MSNLKAMVYIYMALLKQIGGVIQDSIDIEKPARDPDTVIIYNYNSMQFNSLLSALTVKYNV